ncbi:hypothetical protein ACIQZB_12185 [Streptomyces sp. NPDC097727]|uniref:hypothetical protein n=1 Tax=Streptomyces sp. NPDC097727 TaxID=3366092 RepID=UPI00381D71D5
MHGRTRRTLLASAVMAAALLLSACSSDDSAPRVAGDDGTKKAEQQDGAALRQDWVDCMHKQGQTDVELDKDGNITFPASKTDGASAEAYEKAAKICDAKVPGVQQVTGKTQEKLLAQARAFVACARKNGYPDIPDPDPQAGIITFTPTTFDTAKWDAIQPACGKLPMPGYTIGG